ncbi:glycosyltransferase family 1 protein [Haloterrigena sp. H1]|uniref:glycosyltransferase family 4 protein n=1 Tax=Haloterrigena sp. H1 TaxID=2552943 RepID=UPI00110DCF92|nr:glycosyltransferase family 4 protein [Haloterrigena sp. H1]TMT87017.1 glycosyltransferase family 1 protein [Haloterrigena sp. H1]
MNIGIFSSDFVSKPPFEQRRSSTWGGVAEVVYNLSLSLNEKGHEVNIFTNTSSKIDVGKQSFEQITVHRYKSTIEIGGTPVSIPMLYRPLDTELDIAHVHLGFPSNVISGLLYATYHDCPLVLTGHGEIQLNGDDRIRDKLISVFKKFLDYIVMRTDANTAVSKGMIEMVDYFNTDGEYVDVIPNGIDLSDECDHSQEEAKKKLGHEPTEPLILFLGTLVDRKRPDLLIRALARLTDHYPKATCIIAGQGRKRSELEDLAKSKNLNEKVYFPGFIPENKKRIYYKAADVFCLPSAHESFGLVLLEAQLQGTPVVVSDLPCFQEIVNDGQDGYISSRNPEAIAKSIGQILSDSELKAEMSKQASENAKKYSWSTIADQYIELYTKTLNNY